MSQSPTLDLQEVMDYDEGNVMVVPRKPRTRPLGCKRRLNFNDTSLNPKRCRFDDTYKWGRPMKESHGLTPDSGNLKQYHDIGSSSVHIKSSGREEKSVAKDKDDDSGKTSAVVAPSTPLPTMRKRSPKAAISIIQKTSLEQVLELASYSPYYTRSLNEKVLSTITLDDRGHQTVSLKGKESPSLKTTGGASKAWKQLLKKAVAGSCSAMLEKHGSISVELEFHQKVTSFVSKVGNIQGQRVFSPWKGSVLDSIIGALLTQRVSDNLSSSAFMSLGVIFPQDRYHDTYSRHHRMMREQRSKGFRSSPNVENKRREVTLSAKGAKKYYDKEGENSSEENKKPDWKTLRTEYSGNVMRRERGCDAVDYVDWHAVRRADVKDVSKAILLRGMNKKLARRIKDILDRIMLDYGNLDLEWVRNAPPLQAREFLLSFYGLGIKCVQCVQLLTLKQPAFPVDVNVGRVTVRLGWVPVLTNASDELLMSLLEKSSKLHDLIHQYLWPRLRKLDQKTLYELHYQMITFGKVFCTKKKPSCAECPMKRECKSYAEIDIEDSVGWDRLITQKMLRKAKTPLRDQPLLRPRSLREKIIQSSSSTGRPSPKKIGTRTQHYVYELPDRHPILAKFDDRDPDDSSPYLLVIWESDPLATNFSHIVPGTVMIPCRTALRGNFPLNGTYFQTNEVFADQQTSKKPIDVLSKTLQDLQQLQRKTLYCGSDLSNLVKGFSATEVKSLFNEGYICTRGFDRKACAPVALERLLHISF